MYVFVILFFISSLGYMLAFMLDYILGFTLGYSCFFQFFHVVGVGFDVVCMPCFYYFLFLA